MATWQSQTQPSLWMVLTSPPPFTANTSPFWFCRHLTCQLSLWCTEKNPETDEGEAAPVTDAAWNIQLSYRYVWMLLWGMTSLPQHLHLFKKNLFDVWNTRSVTRFTFRTLSLMHRYVWYHSVYSLTALTFHVCDIVKSPATVQVQTFALIRVWKEAVREKDAVIIIKTLKVCKYIQIIS